ncbi:MAG: aspartate aminotransferase family protein [Holophagales bacterium]|nr:MAG: aspartate aminotransferase family protein [Holophagales bacterium]
MTRSNSESPHLVPVYAQLGVEPVAGEGCRLRTADGRWLVDFYGGHAVALLGYGHPRLLAALTEAAGSLFFQSNAVPNAARRRAAERLAAFAPAGLDQVFFVNSGAEANENALRLALRTTRRTRIIAVEGAFHGRTAAAAAVTAGSAKWYGFPSTPFAVTFVPRDDEAALAAVLDDDVAAVIVEPVQGVAGAVALSRDWLHAARRLTAERGALLILDEVQCGMGRTGAPFAAQLHGVTPDLLTTAKGLAGGFPVGALLMGDALAATLRLGDLGTTFGGAPMACALVETVIDVIERDDLLANVRQQSAAILASCRVGPVVDIQGHGFLLGLRTTRPAQEILTELLARGILAGGSGDPHVVRLLPPLVLGREHVDQLAQALSEISA